ncbi:MAG TPA: heparinase II/III family protein, partial [Candidatus Angelobacter sp.]|nr:heparinase II/III family protein [Candidatus Angelobacter sp.]
MRIRMVPYYQPRLDDVSSEQRRTILELADGICQRRIPFLSYETQNMGSSPNWNADFVSGKEWPMEPSHSLAVVRFDGSDIKVPWELSRLQFLPILGKAFCLTHQPGYRAAARQFVDDWIDRNPVGQGANWIVAMEVALRALSILFTLNLLWPLADEEKDWGEKVTHSLWQHLIYIEAHLEFSHILRGNHYLSNLMGLYGLAVFLDGPGMPQRRRRYQRLLEREILLHVYEDGGNYEASSGYHVLVTQIFSTAYQLMRADGAVPAPSFLDRLRTMFVWMDSLADSSGRLPHVGDCDDGRVEYLFDDLRQMATPVTAR